jgi:hypothetical protein
MTPELPFSLECGDALEARPRMVVEEGAVFASVAPGWEEGFPPLLTVAWHDEPPAVALADVVAEELARCLDEQESVLIDQEDVTVAGVEALRTLMVHRATSGPPTASEQWRLLAEGRRWTVSALTTLADQPAFGPPLARIAASLRILPRAAPR